MRLGKGFTCFVQGLSNNLCCDWGRDLPVLCSVSATICVVIFNLAISAFGLESSRVVFDVSPESWILESWIPESWIPTRILRLTIPRANISTAIRRSTSAWRNHDTRCLLPGFSWERATLRMLWKVTGKGCGYCTVENVVVCF